MDIGSLFSSAVSVGRDVVAMTPVGKYMPLVDKALQKARAFVTSARPNRVARKQIRAHKAPIRTRVTVAAGKRAERMAAAIQHAPSRPADAVAAVAHEVNHLSGQFAKVVEDLSDYGSLPRGSFLQNLKNGSIFINGHKISVPTVVVGLALLKSARLVVPAVKSEGGLKEFLFPDVQYMRVPTGVRRVEQQTTAVVKEDLKQPASPFDLYGVWTDPDGTWHTRQASEVTSWPTNAMVTIGVTPHITVEWQGAPKVAAGAFLSAQDNWGLKLLSLFTERFGSLVNLGQGIDFNR